MSDRITDSDLMGLREAKRKTEVWERHGQTIMLFAVTAMLAFSGKFMWDSSKQAAEMTAEMKHMSLSIARLEGIASAMKSEYITRAEFSAYSERLRHIEELSVSSRK
jgi:hypothetical protein